MSLAKTKDTYENSKERPVETSSLHAGEVGNRFGFMAMSLAITGKLSDPVVVVAMFMLAAICANEAWICAGKGDTYDGEKE